MFNHIIHLKFPGETVRVKVLREGKVDELQVPVKPLRPIVPLTSYDEAQPYFVYGGFAFLALSQPFLQEWGDQWRAKAPRDLINIAFRQERQHEDEQPVVLAYCFNGPRAGYTASFLENRQVISVNGHRIVNLRQMYELVQELHATSDQMVFEVYSFGGNSFITLGTDEAEDVLAETLELYNIPAAASKELLDPTLDSRTSL